MDRPLQVTADLVHPIQDDLKTETRRLRDLDPVNEQPGAWTFWGFERQPDPKGRKIAIFEKTDTGHFLNIPCPYGIEGDFLWVRESWYVGKGYDGIKPRDLPKPDQLGHSIQHGYMADGEKPDWAGRTWPGLFMPRWLSRTSLLITDLAVERLYDITEQGAKREGVGKAWQDKNGIFWRPDDTTTKVVGEHGDYVTGFRAVWAQLNGPASWDINPWVWVISFTRKQQKNGH